jgi:hypothetical protein
MFAIAAAIVAASFSGAAQSPTTADGVAALARGDYQRAIEILRPIAERDPAGDPAAQFFLGTMYESGLGVPRDPLRACALYHRAGQGGEPFGGAAMRLHRAGFLRQGAEFSAECQLLGNVGFDHRFEPVTFDLGPGHSIAWSLSGATITYQGRTVVHPQRLAGRGSAYLPMRYTPLQIGGRSPHTRHFVEAFVWYPAGANVWALQWHLFEVVGTDLLRIADVERLATSPARPDASPREDVRRRIEVRTNASGGAEWAILEGPDARTDAIVSDEERREIRALEEARRAALENVDWTRRFDSRRAPSLAYGLNEGCGHVFLYAFTGDRAEAITLRADREALQLSTTAHTFDLARHPEAMTLNVHVFEEPVRHQMFCTDVRLPTPRVELWRAVAGRVTIELSPPGVRSQHPSMYRATVRIEAAEFLDSSGRRHRQSAPIVLSAVVGFLFG